VPASFLLFPWLAGCATDHRAPDDPLTGGEAPRPPVQQAATPPAQGVPPLPAACSAGNTASLALGQPLPDSRELAIQQTGGNSGSNPWNGPGRAADASGAVLDAPQPIVPVSRNTTDPVHGPNDFDRAGSAGAGGGTYEQLQAELAARGMNWYRQEKWGDGVKFICTIPSRANPSKTRTYEAVAGTDVAALRLVLEQIDKGS
jgi:hypothetical protein